MRKTLFNPTIFAYTLYVKFADWRNCVPLFLVMLLPTFSLCMTMLFPHPPLSEEMQRFAIKTIKSFFYDGRMCMLAAYLFISDGLAGRKLIAEAEPLALLFTRPLTRFCYVLSKFCGATVGVTIVFSLGMTLGILAALCYGIKPDPVSPLDWLTILCNAALYSALITMLHSARPAVAMLIFFMMLGTSGMGGMFTSFAKSGNDFLELLKTICMFIGEWFGDFAPQSIDLAALFSAQFLDKYELTIFASNIVVYLLLAGITLSLREFSYGAD